MNEVRELYRLFLKYDAVLKCVDKDGAITFASPTIVFYCPRSSQGIAGRYNTLTWRARFWFRAQQHSTTLVCRLCYWLWYHWREDGI